MTHALIVDDKEENIYYLTALLQGNGFRVSAACNGADALEKAREDVPELVISDLLMPVMDGYTLLLNWRSDDVFKLIPFIVYTATYTEQDDRKLAMDMGADGFILKPCEPDDFMDQVRAIQAQTIESTASPRNPTAELSHLYKSYNESLIRKLEERNLELEAANRRLHDDLITRNELEKQLHRAQRLECIGTLAGGVAHDLNNLLSPILMGVTFARQYDLPEPVRSVLQTIEDSAARGTALVRQVVSFARGGDNEPRGSTDLAPILREVGSIVENTFPHGIDFELDCPNGLPRVNADATQLSQIWLNLCVNARDAMNGTGVLRVSVSEVSVDPDSARRGFIQGRPTSAKYLCVEVSDTGCGIPPEHMEELFSPFFTTKSAEHGTGLGLSTVAGIVKSHEGFIEVESELGNGTAFRVYLPLDKTVTPEKAEHENDPLNSAAEYPAGLGESVLVVDDEASIRGMTCQTLESFGYTALSAEGGLEALALFRADHSKVDLVLTDLQMPCMDGTALIEALQAIDPNVRCVVTSGYSQGPALEKLGVKHFLQKPYSAKDLLVILREVL
ncbi:MAG: response regulator [Verrucomicrobiales bacterium]